jgi:hypothetical protein
MDGWAGMRGIGYTGSLPPAWGEKLESAAKTEWGGRKLKIYNVRRWEVHRPDHCPIG